MPNLILFKEETLYCSQECADKDRQNCRTNQEDYKAISTIVEYARINWEWTEEDGQGAMYGELCPVCETNYQDALDPKGVLERY